MILIGFLEIERKVSIATTPREKAMGGFTLIEIAVAIAILGLGLATLVALQTRYMATYELERNRTTAALAAQYLLTKIENAKEIPEQGGTGGDLRDWLEKEGYYEYQPDLVRPEDINTLEGWTVQLTVTSQDIPPDEDVLRRLDLNVTWGATVGESLNFVYYIRVPRKSPSGGGSSMSGFGGRIGPGGEGLGNIVGE